MKRAEYNCIFYFTLGCIFILYKRVTKRATIWTFNAGVIEKHVRGLIMDDAKGAMPFSWHKSTTKTMASDKANSD